jgi:hypothetical protein
MLSWIAHLKAHYQTEKWDVYSLNTLAVTEMS